MEQFPILDEAWAERTRGWIRRCHQAIIDTEAMALPRGIHPLLRQAELNGLRSLKADLEQQLAEFEGRK